MPVTLKDIAERVGKSIPTVSRALGDFADISPETRREVQRVAQEMGYEPSVTARNLQRRRTDSVSLILPSSRYLRLSDPFFGELISGVVDKTAEEGFNLNISTDASEQPREIYLKQIRGRRADGFIVVRTRREDERINLLREHGVPFVAFGRTEGDNDFCWVDDDGATGIRLVVDHLVMLGHRRLGFVAEPLTLTKSYHRAQGFQQALEMHDLPQDPELFVETNFRQPSGERAVDYFLALDHPPTAIVTCNDLLALGAMNALRKRGLAVGQDVSVTGFDDIILAEHANPPITTVHLPAWEMGRCLADTLIALIRGQIPRKRQMLFKPRLIIRSSSGPPQSDPSSSRR